jgi:hypothetical protein
VDEHNVKLTIWSSAIPAADLAREVALDPDEQWERGDPGPGGRPRSRSGIKFGSGLSDQTDASEQVSALLARLAPCSAAIGALVSEETDVTLSIGYFVNESQWQAHDAGVLVRGLGVALNAAHIEILHAMRASFDIDFYVNVNVDVEDE